MIDRFSFGKNWRSFASIVDEESIAEAERGLLKLFPHQELSGARVLDIGCGSGLSIAAALRLGAAHIHGIDVDSDSVRAAVELLSRFDMPQRWSVETIDLFDLPVCSYDIVYSWGVLHHTGAMREAIKLAARAVEPGGLFAFALYHRTRMCSFWTWEKRWYSRASPRVQGFARRIYIALLRLRFHLTGREFHSYVTNYKSQRGMDFAHDVHDWMGGYPYESISAPEVETLMRRLGFEHVRSFTSPVTIGLFGSGCDEYVYRSKA